MPISKTTFKNPPAVEVKAAVQFPNNLLVADDRAGFHAMIKREFPFVVMPDLKQLQYDFGDYTIYTENQVYRLEIAMNYFRLVAAKYTGFQDFRKMYLAAVSMFARYYRIMEFNSFAFQYVNKLPLPGGITFDECFTIKVTLPEELGVSLYVGKGLLVFKEDDGFVLIELEPQLTGLTPESYGMNLTFSVERHLTVSDDRNEVIEFLDKAHDRLSDFFFSILQPKVIEHLQSR